MKFAAILVCSLFALATAQETTPANPTEPIELGINLGWGHPLGASLEAGYHVAPADVVFGGFGFSMSGTRFGGGIKHFFRAENKLALYVGLAGAYSAGLDKVTVTSGNSDSAIFRMESGALVAPRAGLRYRAGWCNFYLNGGYGFVVSGGDVEYRSGSTKASLQDVARVFALGGPEVSLSTFLRF